MKQKLYERVAKPLLAGLYGFSLFLIIVVLTKLIGAFIGSTDGINLSMSDVYISLIGFFLLSLIKVLEFYREE
ncbi:MAG: hypothetical protein K9N07_09820 [Candidatus Cloacimonetes bacterium]|nr:hypothetical protein [Candidatus Cloacimonadota bacterium]